MASKRAAWLGPVTGLVAVMLGAYACSGGTEGPDVSGPGPGWDESPVPHPPNGEPSPTPTVPPQLTGGTTTTTWTTGTWTTTTWTTTGPCQTCLDWYYGAAISNPCSTVLEPLNALYDCLCEFCTEDCMATCGSGDSPDSTCQSCASLSCTSELTTCTYN